MTRHPGPPRDGHGKFLPTPEGARRQAEIVRLRITEGMTYKQIAERLGIAEQTAADHFRKGIRAIPRDTANELAETVLHQRQEDERRLRDIAASPPNVVSAQGKDTGVPDQNVAIRALREADTIRDRRLKTLGIVVNPAAQAERERVRQQHRDAITKMTAEWEHGEYEHQLRVLAAGHPLIPPPPGWTPQLPPADPADIVDAELLDDDDDPDDAA